MLLVLLALGLGLFAIFLLGVTTQSAGEFGRLQGAILIANVAAFAVLLSLIVGNLIRLLRELRMHESGARLKARMVYAFVGLAITPMLLVYLFAVQFLDEGIETWFDVQVERGLDDALELSRSALDLTMTEQLARTRALGEFLPAPLDSQLFPVLAELRVESEATELAVFGENLRVYSFSSASTDAIYPDLPDDDMLLQLRIEGSVVRLEPAQDGGYQVRTLVALAPMRAGIRVHMLQGIYPVGEQLGPLADSVQQTYSRYKELAFLRDPLKQTVVLTLSLVVLLALLTAVYGAFFFARRLVSPLENLVAGTRAVAEGDLETRLPQASRDEIGFLVSSFNDMIDRLARARADARRNERQVETERSNLEAILAGLSNGVIALNADASVRIVNEAACQILESDFSELSGIKPGDLPEDNSLLSQFAQALAQRLREDGNVWKEQIELNSDQGRKVLVCSSALLSDSDDADGLVVVFADITALLQAQRNAAWGEVARRLAHEIKNPLTPIQLSAERIRRKFLGEEVGEKAELLDRATQTIVQQVEAMRDMVNSFSEYARAPQVRIADVDINQLILQVVDLYPELPNQPQISLELDPQLGIVKADGNRIRQVLHNLIRNSVEAMESTSDPQILIETRLREKDRGNMVEIEVSDSGPGFPEDELDKVFEPYVTTKQKGTGLGLAIVKKLIEEHGGDVSVPKSRNEDGACVRILLPVEMAAKDKAGAAQAADRRRISG